MTRPPWLRRGLSSVVLCLLLSLAPADNTATPPSMAYRAGVPVSDLWSRRTVGEETGEVKRLRQAEHNIEVLNDRLVDAIRARDRDNSALREKDDRLAALTAQLESASANDAKVRAEHEQSVASLKAQLDSSQTQVEALGTRVNELQGQLHESEDRREEDHRRLQELLAQEQALMENFRTDTEASHLIALLSEKEALAKAKAELNSTQLALFAEKQALTQVRGQLTAALQAADAKVAEQRQMVQSLQEQLAAAKQAGDHFQRMFHSEAQRLKDAHALHNRVRQTKSEAKEQAQSKEIGRLNAALAAAARDKEEVLQSHAAALCDLKAALQKEAKVHAAQAEAERDGLGKEITRLNAALASARQEKETIEHTIATAVAKLQEQHDTVVSKLVDERETLTSQMAALNRDHAEALEQLKATSALAADAAEWAAKAKTAEKKEADAKCAAIARVHAMERQEGCHAVARATERQKAEAALEERHRAALEATARAHAIDVAGLEAKLGEVRCEVVAERRRADSLEAEIQSLHVANVVQEHRLRARMLELELAAGKRQEQLDSGRQESRETSKDREQEPRINVDVVETGTARTTGPQCEHFERVNENAALSLAAARSLAEVSEMAIARVRSVTASVIRPLALTGGGDTCGVSRVPVSASLPRLVSRTRRPVMQDGMAGSMPAGESCGSCDRDGPCVTAAMDAVEETEEEETRSDDADPACRRGGDTGSSETATTWWLRRRLPVPMSRAFGLECFGL